MRSAPRRRRPRRPTRPSASWPGSRRCSRPRLGGDAVAAVSHGTTVATNQLLEGKVESLGFVTTEGYEHVLEIARQSVPDGYGNSYFWVKPPRIVPADRVQTSAGGWPSTAARSGPSTRSRRATRGPVLPRPRDRPIGVCFLHSYADPTARAGDARRPRRRAPRRGGVDLVGRAARVPRVRALGHDARRRRGQAEHPRLRGDHRRAPGDLGRRQAQPATGEPSRSP